MSDYNVNTFTDLAKPDPNSSLDTTTLPQKKNVGLVILKNGLLSVCSKNGVFVWIPNASVQNKSY